jgi:multiple sugar transport system permease protein
MKPLTISRTGIAQPAAAKSRWAQREALWGILCVSPAILGFLIWTAGPMLASLYIAFTDWKVGLTPNWVGLQNFQTLFADDLFYKSSGVTIYFSLLSVPLSIVFAFALALLLNQHIQGVSIFRTIFYLPSLVPIFASSMLWLWLFNPDFGLLNAVLKAVGLPGLQWIYDENQVIPSLVIMSLWGVGPMMIIFLAGLQGVPRYLYEAVEVDGGNAWHKLRHITIPMVTPTILFNLVLSIIGALQTFTQGYVLTAGGPNNASLFYILYLYRQAFQNGLMGLASAMAWLLFIVIAVLTVIVFRSSSGWVHYEGGR